MGITASVGGQAFPGSPVLREATGSAVGFESRVAFTLALKGLPTVSKDAAVGLSIRVREGGPGCEAHRGRRVGGAARRQRWSRSPRRRGKSTPA